MTLLRLCAPVWNVINVAAVYNAIDAVCRARNYVPLFHYIINFLTTKKNTETVSFYRHRKYLLPLGQTSSSSSSSSASSASSSYKVLCPLTKTRTADITVKNSHKNSANKNVFKSFLKRVWVCAWRIVSASRFQATGPACENARSPNLDCSLGVT